MLITLARRRRSRAVRAHAAASVLADQLRELAPTRR